MRKYDQNYQRQKQIIQRINKEKQIKQGGKRDSQRQISQSEQIKIQDKNSIRDYSNQIILPRGYQELLEKELKLSKFQGHSFKDQTSRTTISWLTQYKHMSVEGPDKKELDRIQFEKIEFEKKYQERRQLERKQLEQKELERKEIVKKQLEQKELERKYLERKQLERKQLERKQLERKESEEKLKQQKQIKIIKKLQNQIAQLDVKIQGRLKAIREPYLQEVKKQQQQRMKVEIQQRERLNNLLTQLSIYRLSKYQKLVQQLKNDEK